VGLEKVLAGVVFVTLSYIITTTHPVSLGAGLRIEGAEYRLLLRYCGYLFLLWGFYTIYRKIREFHKKMYEDSLTGVYNRYFFERMIRRVSEKTAKKKRPVSLAMVDLDNLRAINEVLGHSGGDVALASAAKALKEKIGRKNLICRYGGDEFVILMPNLGSSRAMKLANSLSNLEISIAEFNIKISVGTASFPEDSTDPSKLVTIADERMYKHKMLKRT
jgi:diguanylate cyclase (GGDEF)-like protein